SFPGLKPCHRTHPQRPITSPKTDPFQGDYMRARFFLVFVLLAAVSLSAQTFRGTILGTVTDPSGAVIAGAKVTVKNTGTGLERSTETSGDGSRSEEHTSELQSLRHLVCRLL